MNFKKNVLVFSVFLMAGLTHAELARSNNDQIKNNIRECSSFNGWVWNFKDEPAGEECITRNKAGSIIGHFKRVNIHGESAIQDLGENGKIWFDKIDRRVSYYLRFYICIAENGKFLPTKSDIELAESRGFREAFDGDMADQDFWLSDKYYFSLNNNVNRIRPFYGDVYASVRCVSTPSGEIIN